MRSLQMQFIGSHTNARWFKILSIVESERFFSIKNLATRTDVSQRTIIKDINYLKEHFAGSALFETGINGYQFDLLDIIQYKEKKQSLLENELLFEIVGNIFYGDKETIEDVCDYYNSSESTVRRLLLQIQPTLLKYDLELQMNPIDFIGEEAHLRKFFKDFYYVGEETPHTLWPPKNLHDMVLTKIIHQLEHFSLGTGMPPAAFYYSFFIAIERYSQGLAVKIPDYLKKIIYADQDFLKLCSLYSEIKKEFSILLSKEEFAWIYLITICKRTVDRPDKEHLFIKQYNIYPQIKEIATLYVSQNFKYHPNQAEFITYFQSFFLSKKMNNSFSQVENIVMDEVQSSVRDSNWDTYQNNYDFLLSQNKKLQFPIKYIEDIAASLTLYSELIAEQYIKPKKVLFLFEGDYLLCQSTKLLAQQLLGSNNEILFVPLKEWTERQINDYTSIDLIVTNYAQYFFDYKEFNCILVNDILNKNDWTYIIGEVNPLLKKILL